MNSNIRAKMFIGSSTEGLPIAKAIQANLDYDCEAIVWAQGVFGLGGGTLESLVDKLDDFDFACLVLTPDDLIKSRRSSQPAPRDNVLLELGLFIARLGRKRTFVVYDRTVSLKLPSDLAGVTTATFQPHASANWQAALGAACTQIETAVRELGIRRRRNTEQGERCKVEIYYHSDGLTRDHAEGMLKALKEYGLEAVAFEHGMSTIPDAVFIGALVRAADARYVLSLLNYEIKYLFRPDYPESEGGDSKGLKIGLGFVSHYNIATQNKRTRPIQVTQAELDDLLSSRRSDTEFQCLLHRITRSYEIALVEQPTNRGGSEITKRY